ncbi:MAG: hypothetical protein PVI91_03035 [Gammaproteobacteria bacterium]|jgi:hypothetical protein
MGLAAISRIPFRLALALCSATLSTAAAAIPSSPQPLALTDVAASTAPAEGVDPALQRNFGSAPATSVASPDPVEQPPPAGPGTPITPPCLHDVSDAKPLKLSTDQTLCAKPVDGRERFSLRIGRRIHGSHGLLEQVDGLLVNYRLGNGTTLTAVAGSPAAAATDPLNLGSQVFGVSAGMTRLAPAWDLSSYFIEHQKKGRTEGRTLGSVLRYLRPKRSVLMSLDYDANENALSTVMISGAWKLLRQTTVSATFDVSRSNGHRGREGFLQQSLAATEGWKWALPVDRIRELTGGHATGVSSLGVGLSHRFSRHLKLNGDVAVLDISRPPASGAPLHPNEYFYHVKLTGEDLVLSGDQSALALRYNVTDSSRTSSATLDTKYTINRLWQINPRLHTDYHSDTMKNAVDWITAPAVKMEYRWRPDYGIEIEAGGKWSSRTLAAENRTQSSYFLSLNYQANF